MIRFLRFAAAGTIGFVVQIGLLAALVKVFGMNYLLATAIAVEAAILANFVQHHYWTWNDRPGPQMAQPGPQMAQMRGMADRFVRFNILTGVTAIFGSLFVTVLLVERFGVPVLAANIASVMLLSAINFVGADRLVFRTGATIVLIGFASSAYAGGEARLQAKTAVEFVRYSATVEARSAESLAKNEPFLFFERHSKAEQSRILALLRRGEVHLERAAGNAAANEVAVDGGLINHWRGTVFIPRVTLDHVLKVLQDPDAPLHKQEDVLSYKLVPKGIGTQHLFIRLKRTKFVTVVYDTEYDVAYRTLAPDRAMSHSISTKILEIENAGTPRERAMPEGNDHGYMWRLNSYWRYRQVDDGVLVEVESLTLSRDLPAIIGPLIRPIVTSTARESMTRTLASMRARFVH